jgi:hypothetical protein
MNWGENFWVWFATEVFFGIFVAVLLYVFFVRRAQKEREERDKENERNKKDS